MNIRILGDFPTDQLYCAGSVTKFLTAYVVLSKLAEKDKIEDILDDDDFLDKLAASTNKPAAKEFLTLFQKIIGSKFTLRDIFTYYTGLPYTFEPDKKSLRSADLGYPFKHHSLMNEADFLEACRNRIKPLFPNRSKYHYSELSIIFIAYFIEKVYGVRMEDLYQQFIANPCHLTHSRMSRTRPDGVLTRDLSSKYDYAAVAVQDHGFFCYSNGFYTTLNELKIIIESIEQQPVFQHMTDLSQARVANGNVISGLSLELRVVGNDVVYGYEGLSFSGCNIWSCSRNNKQGYLMFCDDETAAYTYIYKQFGYTDFDPAPSHTTQLCMRYLANTPAATKEEAVPELFQGEYQRVKLNEVEIESVCVVGSQALSMHDPDPVDYSLSRQNGSLHILDEHHSPDSRISFYTVASGNQFMFYNGSLYRHRQPKLNVADIKLALSIYDGECKFTQAHPAIVNRYTKEMQGQKAHTGPMEMLEEIIERTLLCYAEGTPDNEMLISADDCALLLENMNAGFRNSGISSAHFYPMTQLDGRMTNFATFSSVYSNEYSPDAIITKLATFNLLPLPAAFRYLKSHIHDVKDAAALLGAIANSSNESALILLTYLPHSLLNCPDLKMKNTALELAICKGRMHRETGEHSSIPIGVVIDTILEIMRKNPKTCHIPEMCWLAATLHGDLATLLQLTELSFEPMPEAAAELIPTYDSVKEMLDGTTSFNPSHSEIVWRDEQEHLSYQTFSIYKEPIWKEKVKSCVELWQQLTDSRSLALNN